MGRYKESKNLLNPENDGDIFLDLPYFPWVSDRSIRFEEVELWEVITEWNGLSGIYAAALPHAEYYVVLNNWTIKAEFEGWNANNRLEEYLIVNNIPYPKGADIPVEKFEQKKLFVIPKIKELVE